MAEKKAVYPVNLSIDYPEQLNRLTTFFRFILMIPIIIILAMLIGNQGDSDAPEKARFLFAGGFVFGPTLLLILFRKKYPRWWFDWNVALVKFVTRVVTYLVFLRDEYPSTDEEQAVHIKIAYPNAKKDLKRGMPLVKWLLAFPHYVVLAFLAIAAVFCVLIAWFAVIFTGKYPKGLFDFVVGVLRWDLRVDAYVFLLTTDQYPPFTLYE
jgi:hypothetical protein